MTKLDAIAKLKSLRQSFDAPLQALKEFFSELGKDKMDTDQFQDKGEVMAQTKLSQRGAEEAIMRLGMALKYTGNPTPYGESRLTPETLAKQCYDAYCASTGGKSAVTGAPLPTWEALTEQAATDERMKGVRDGWLAVANTHPALLYVAPTADNLKM